MSDYSLNQAKIDIARLQTDVDKFKRALLPVSGRLYVRDDVSVQREGVTYDAGIFVPLSTPLTSTSFDGDGFSTTGKTLIDLSVAFGAPAGIKAILCRVGIQDASASSFSAWFGLSPNDTADSLTSFLKIYGLVDDAIYYENVVVPCNADGDVYYQCRASGAGTLDVTLQIWGYWL